MGVLIYAYDKSGKLYPSAHEYTPMGLAGCGSSGSVGTYDDERIESEEQLCRNLVRRNAVLSIVV